MRHRLNGRQTVRGHVLNELAEQIKRLGRRGPIPKHLAPRRRLDLRELVFGIVGVHGEQLLLGGRAEHLDDLYQLIDRRFAGKQRLSQHQLGHDAARRPDIDGRRVVCAAKHQLGRPVVPRADVRDVGLARHEDLCAAEITQLGDARDRIEQLQVSTDARCTRNSPGSAA